MSVAGSPWLSPEAVHLRLPTRIGLEDVTTGPAGEPVTGNTALVRHALTIWYEAPYRELFTE